MTKFPTTTQTFDSKFLTITSMGTNNLQNSQQLLLTGVDKMGCLLLFIKPLLSVLTERNMASVGHLFLETKRVHERLFHGGSL